MENGFGFTDILKVREILTNHNNNEFLDFLHRAQRKEALLASSSLKTKNMYPVKLNIACCSYQRGQLFHPV